MARTAAKNIKPSSLAAKTKPQRKEVPKTPVAVEEVPPSTGAEAGLSSGESSDSEDEDDEGVDEEGMAKMMQLLGEDGLDDFAEHQLSELGLGDEAGESDEDEDGNEGEDSEDEDESVATGDEGDRSDSGWVDEDEEMEAPGSSKVRLVEDGDENEDEEASEDEEEDNAVPLDEVSDVDEDVVPRQKVVINNEVSVFDFGTCASKLLTLNLGTARASTYQGND